MFQVNQEDEKKTLLKELRKYGITDDKICTKMIEWRLWLYILKGFGDDNIKILMDKLELVSKEKKKFLLFAQSQAEYKYIGKKILNQHDKHGIFFIEI